MSAPLEQRSCPVRRLQPQHRQADRGLAGAALADQAQRLALAHRRRYAVHRAHMADDPAQQPAADREMHLSRSSRSQQALAHRPAPAPARPGRLGLEQHARVGVLRAAKHVGDATGLDQPRRPSSRTPGRRSGGRSCRSWVISSSARPRRRFSAAQQVQDLRLDGDVERGGRLVGDQQLGVVGERHGDHHPLPLAAGELVRKGVEPAARRRRSPTWASRAAISRPRSARTRRAARSPRPPGGRCGAAG